MHLVSAYERAHNNQQSNKWKMNANKMKTSCEKNDAYHSFSIAIVAAAVVNDFISLSLSFFCSGWVFLLIFPTVHYSSFFFRFGFCENLFISCVCMFGSAYDWNAWRMFICGVTQWGKRADMKKLSKKKKITAYTHKKLVLHLWIWKFWVLVYRHQLEREE